MAPVPSECSLLRQCVRGAGGGPVAGLSQAPCFRMGQQWPTCGAPAPAPLLHPSLWEEDPLVLFAVWESELMGKALRKPPAVMLAEALWAGRKGKPTPRAMKNDRWPLHNRMCQT